MKLAILSDFHLGYRVEASSTHTQQSGSGREGDSFRQAKEALEIAEQSDIILLTGDLFDQRVPRQEILAKALELFSAIKTPTISISGTHERRSSGYINPVQILEKAGFLTHLHLDSKTLEVGGEKVNIFGMSGVPERYAEDILKKWDPKPLPGLNILLLHQNIKEYIYNPIDPVTLSLSSFPEGFDLFVCGHIHWRDTSKAPSGTPVIFPGSTIRTQLKQAETEPKGVTLFTPPDKFKFKPLKAQRKFFYERIEFKEATPRQVRDKVKKKLKEIETKDSLVKLKLSGTLAEGFRSSDLKLRSLTSDACVLSVDKDFSSEVKTTRKTSPTAESIEELGLRLLREKLGSDEEALFHYLRDGKLDRAKEKLLS